MTAAGGALRGKRIVVIDDHKNIRVSLKMTLESDGAEVRDFAGFREASDWLDGGTNPNGQNGAFDCLLLDIRLPDGNGLDILKLLADRGHAARVIMISGEGTASDAFKATQLGAFDYVDKPFTPERILVSVNRCLGFNEIQADNDELKQRLASIDPELLGQSKAMKELKKMIGRVAPTNGRVLIVGESGTGKELVAREIHQQSQRCDNPLIKINCAAIPASLIESELFGHEKGAFTGAHKMRRGVFELADRGTLFLDEIGELDIAVQAKLLRVLQSGELTRVGSETSITVDVRLIAATNRDLQEMVTHGDFREDLYYRLNVVTLNMPPLRSRPGDIKTLAEAFLNEACIEHSLGPRTLSAKAIADISSHQWPGNVRELKNYIERLAILSEESDIQTLEPFGPGTAPVDENIGDGPFVFRSNLLAWQDFHQTAGTVYLKYVLRQTNGNVSEAARLLCLERAYLHRLMRKLGVQRDVVVQ